MSLCLHLFQSMRLRARKKGQTLDYCSLHSLTPCSFFDPAYIFPKLLSLGLVSPRAPTSKLDVRQLAQLSLGTWNSPARFHFLSLTKGRVQSVNRIKECTMKKSPEQNTVKEFSLSALQRKGIQASLHFIPLFIQKFCLRSSNLLILLRKKRL